MQSLQKLKDFVSDKEKKYNEIRDESNMNIIKSTIMKYEYAVNLIAEGNVNIVENKETHLMSILATHRVPISFGFCDTNMAVRDVTYQTIKLLLDNNADINITINNQNALSNACTNYCVSTGDLNILKLLFSHKINPNTHICNKRIFDDLKIVENICFSGGPISEIIELFMQNGFNIYENNFYGSIKNICSSSKLFNHHMPHIMSVQRDLLLKIIINDLLPLPISGGHIILYQMIVDYSTPSG